MAEQESSSTYESFSSEDKDDNEEEESSEKEKEEILIDFEFYDPRNDDYGGLMMLTKSYLDNTKFDCEGMSKAIIEQTRVGSIIKCGGENEEPLGFITVFNMRKYENELFMRQIINYMMENNNDEEQKNNLKEYMDNNICGLIVNERMFNCPYEIGPPLNQALFEEMKWAKSDEPTKELRNSYKFEYYIIMTRIYQVNESIMGLQNMTSLKPLRKKKKTNNGGIINDIIYRYPEDEFYHEASSFSYIMKKNVEFNEELIEKRLVMVINHDAAQKARGILDMVVGNPAASASDAM